MYPGHEDLARSAADLASRLPESLAPLAHIAYNYAWSWVPGGDDTFESIDPERWRRTGYDPVRLLGEVSGPTLARAAADPAIIDRVNALDAAVRARLDRPSIEVGQVEAEHPVAFVCAEFGVHRSLPVYSGGLGALAGDILKQASDDAFPMVGVGLMYGEGYFRQRLNASGRQLEYWVDTDPARVPAALVTGADGAPVKISVLANQETVTAQIWRVDVGRVPLYLLDADLPENSIVARWTTGRLYVGDPQIRLAQYALLGIGTVRALAAMGITPSVFHLNEGHGALAALELAREAIGNGDPLDRALETVRQRVVFTTHTPVPAGNDSYPASRAIGALGAYAREIGLEDEELLRLGRTDPLNFDEEFGITQLALRTSRAANAVSRRHGSVSREMWRGLWPGRSVEGVPISHVTNGAHVPTWLGDPMRELLDRYLSDGWIERAADPVTWAPLADAPASELWAVRQQQRAFLIKYVRERSVLERLSRGQERAYVEAATDVFEPEALTVGFARRLATYKRLDLLVRDHERGLGLFSGDRPVQLLLAGKAHPSDEEGKHLVERLFSEREAGNPRTRVIFLDDYDLSSAALLVQGCDVWLNLPRPPLEASGTSGMKSAFNGGLQFSVLDGWWAEGYDPGFGWALSGEVEDDHAAQDDHHAAELYRVLEQEIIPAFHDRDDAGIPQAWVERVRASMIALGPAFSAARMALDYQRKVYAGRS